jgi:hypothetical protein
VRARITRALTAAAGAATIAILAGAAPGSAAAGHGVTVFTPSGGAPIPTNANCPFGGPIAPPRSPAPPAINCARVGYQASGRDFRFAQALITVPDHLGSVSSADPVLYVALDNSTLQNFEYARVGIAPCPAGVLTFIVPAGRVTCPTTGNTSDWVAFAAAETPGVIPPGTPGPTPNVVVEPLSGNDLGAGIVVSAYLVPNGTAVHTVIQLPDGTTYDNTFPVAAPVYTRAQALADWRTALANGASKPQPPVPPGTGRDCQFLRGRFTTASGQRGTFSGPWALNALEATSNGTLPPTGTLMAQPSYLWADANGPGGLDAFGVWTYPF